MTARHLPAEFADLSPFVADWALASEKERHRKLLSRSVAEMRPFYEAMVPRLPAIGAYLDRLPLDALSPEARTLFDLAVSFVETAHPVDLGWTTTDSPDAFPAARVRYLEPGGW